LCVGMMLSELLRLPRLYYAFAVQPFCERESRPINENAPCSGLCDPDEMPDRGHYLDCTLFKQLN
jgi:hypothetical protein